MARARYLARTDRDALRRAATPANALVLDVCEHTGLRVGDVLAITTEALAAAHERRGWLEVTERKTGKRRKVRLTAREVRDMRALAGRVFVFEHRTDPTKHRSRSTVLKQMKRSAAAYGIDPEGVSPHALRKVYSVELLRKTGDLTRVQKALNHENIELTAWYAMSDRIHGAGQKRSVSEKRKARGRD